MRKKLLAIAALSIALLTGCSDNQTIEDKVISVLGEMAEIEKDFETFQGELTEIEQTEQQIFLETMTLTQNQTTKIKENVEKLTETLEERVLKIDAEAETMQKANALVADLSKLEEATELEKEAVEKVKEATNHRYQLHHVFVENYAQFTNLQRILYEMIVEVPIDAAKLDEQVEAVNKQNQLVIQAVKDFNEATIVLNETRDEVFTQLKKE